MINIIFLPTKNNLGSHLYAESNSDTYRYTEEIASKKLPTYYHAYSSNPESFIGPEDYCIITNPYDGSDYLEQCKSVAQENGRDIFYGMEGTRCLLCDASKILATTDRLLNAHIPVLAGSFITEFLDQRSKENKPDFWDG